MMNKKKKITIMTIGHSTHSIEDFVNILESHGVELLVDVRTIPKSRHNPQFNMDTLPSALGKIGYVHFSGLGGLRHPKKDSLNTGWKNDSFRGFADYMQTDEFAKSLDELIELARTKQIAIMCAEAVPWRCHRSLIADALFVQKINVEHIYSVANIKPHKLTSFAKLNGKIITYPQSDEPLFANQ